MGKSDSLKNGMRSGLDGLLSSTGKSTQKKEPAPVKTEKEPAVHCNFVINKSIHTRMKYLAIEKNMSLRDIVNEAMKEYLEKNGAEVQNMLLTEWNWNDAFRVRGEEKFAAGKAEGEQGAQGHGVYPGTRVNESAIVPKGRHGCEPVAGKPLQSCACSMSRSLPCRPPL